MILGIDYIKSLGRLLLLLKSKSFLAAKVAVARFSLSRTRYQYYIIEWYKLSIETSMGFEHMWSIKQ